MNENPNTELQVVPAETALENPAATAVHLIQAAMSKGITAENAEVAEKMLALLERMDAKKAEREFNADFASLQQHMPTIQAMKNVESKGKLLYTYAPFRDIMAQLQPFLTTYGFSVSFIPGRAADCVTEACVVRHKGGHKETFPPFSVRVGSGPPNSSPAQADGAAAEYAKRLALSNAFNIVVIKDTDARVMGEEITQEQAGQYRERVKACGINELFFLQFAQVVLDESANPGQIAEGYQRIHTSICPALERLLKTREAKKAQPA